MEARGIKKWRRRKELRATRAHTRSRIALGGSPPGNGAWLLSYRPPPL